MKHMNKSTLSLKGLVGCVTVTHQPAALVSEPIVKRGCKWVIKKKLLAFLSVSKQVTTAQCNCCSAKCGGKSVGQAL